MSETKETSQEEVKQEGDFKVKKVDASPVLETVPEETAKIDLAAVKKAS